MREAPGEAAAVSAGPAGAVRVSPGWSVTEQPVPPGWFAMEPRSPTGLEREGSARGERLQTRVRSGNGAQPWAPASLVAVGVGRETVRIPGFTAGFAPGSSEMKPAPCGFSALGSKSRTKRC